MVLKTDFNGVNDPAKTISAGSLTPQKFEYSIVDFLSEYEAICETALGRESEP
jgi:hypothetical protein